MISSRRNFLIGAAASLVTAPAIVRAASLMPVKALPLQGYIGRFLGFDIVYGCSPAMTVLPALRVHNDAMMADLIRRMSPPGRWPVCNVAI